MSTEMDHEPVVEEGDGSAPTTTTDPTAHLPAMIEDARAYCLATYRYHEGVYFSAEARELHINADARSTARDREFAMAWNAGYARGVAEGRRQAAAEIAEKIRNELVCCDIYERLAPLRVEVAAAKPGWGEAYRELDNAIDEHAICYWGEASARLAEGPCHEKGSTDG